MINEELKSLVKAEALLLREHATVEELNNLDFSRVMSTSAQNCIYGQMTGNCYSRRATELLSLCAVPYSLHLRNPISYPVSDNEVFIASSTRTYYSPVEYYLHMSSNSVFGLIDYLKGNTTTLEL